MTLSLPHFVMSQNVSLCLLVQRTNIMVGKIDRFNPVTRGIYHLNPSGSTARAAHDQHRRQAYG